APERRDLLFAVNTNWDVLLHAPSQRYYVLEGDGWITTQDLQQGPWSVEAQPPFKADALPGNPNWSEVRKHLPGTPAASAPRVFVSVAPAELILTRGRPELAPIPGTHLARVRNTDSTLFQDTEKGTFYYLVAGRWFSADALSGPWAAATDR